MEKGILDVLTEGIISVDPNGKIKTFNRKARHIFGIDSLSEVEHDSGKLEDGDVVIIVTTALGQDDGNMSSEDLIKIGIEKDISPGTSVIALGRFNEKEPSYIKVLDQSKTGTKLEMTHVYRNRRISARLDLKTRFIDISIDGRNFSAHYIKSFGHMVVLDKSQLDVKFVQTQGYSYRKESIGELINGGRFKRKVKRESANLVGKPLEEVLNEPALVTDLKRTASGVDKGFESRYMDIHDHPVLCALRPVQSESEEGTAILIVEDISELNTVIRERNQAITELDSIREQLMRQKKLDPMPEFIGSSIAMVRLKQLAINASKSISTALLLGESGTGKTILAQAIHTRSSLSAGPFVQVNCGALPEHLIESELFGYEAGAFTGANRKGKPGFFQLADGGTLFLDEVGEIPLHVQVKLLHAIQHNAFYRVGGTTPIKVRVRIIAATNRNLEHAVSIGQFREDLFYRLNVLRIQIPPLRERREDIGELISALLPQICSRIENRQVKVSRDALYTLQSYSYPGNVRELENILERAVNLCEDGEIKKDHLLMEGVKEPNQFSSEYDLIRPLKEVVQEAEKKEIIKAIARTEGDRDLALKKLGIGKSSFYEKLKKYNIRH